jgi:ArsR family transcriptional regulator, arsenate/arsenite/antimonite-responsive transcriptional repressor
VKPQNVELACAELAMAVAQPARVRLLGLLAKAGRGGACVKDLVPQLELSQPTVSHHLKVLRETGLVRLQKAGRDHCYTITPVGKAILRTLNVQVAKLVESLAA